MPPPSSPSDVEVSSGSCLIAHQTMQISPIRGIFSASINQTNPQVTSGTMLPPNALAVTSRPSSGAPSPCALSAQRRSTGSEPRDPLQPRHALGDLFEGQSGYALDSELLDVE